MTHHEWKVKSIISTLKEKKFVQRLYNDVYIRSVTKEDDLFDKDKGIDLIGELTRWRNDAMRWFPSQFKANRFRTKSWFKKHLMDRQDRVLFLLFNEDGNLGHLGLSNFNFDNNVCEIDNVVRGRKAVPGIMTKAVDWMVEFAYQDLGMTHIELRVFSDNRRAIALYERCGFEPVEKIPLKAVKKEKELVYEPLISGRADRYNLRMKHNARS